MDNGQPKDIEYKDGERVLFKGKLKPNPRSKNADIVDCYVTERSVTIEIIEPLKIPLDRIDDCYFTAQRPTMSTLEEGIHIIVTLRYRDALRKSLTAEFEAMSVYDAGNFEDTVKRAQLRLRWADAWTRELVYCTESTAKLTESHTGFLRTLQEKLCDKTRDRLYAKLCAMGLDARMVERGQVQEEIGMESAESLGLIEIRQSPVRLVNVLKEKIQTVSQGGGGFTSTNYIGVYLIHDPEVDKMERIYIESTRVKNFPVFGRVIDLRWKDYTYTAVPNLIKRLGQDESLKQALISLKEDIKVESYPDCACWAIRPPGYGSKVPAPSREQWDCYETIARHLLEASGKTT